MTQQTDVLCSGLDKGGKIEISSVLYASLPHVPSLLTMPRDPPHSQALWDCGNGGKRGKG